MSLPHAVQVCRKNYRYANVGHAKRDRDNMLAKFGSWTQVFRCSVCGGFHLGTPYSQRCRVRDSA